MGEVKCDNRKTVPGIGLPAGSDYPNLDKIPSEPCKDVFWRKEVIDAFESAQNGYSFYRPSDSAVFAKDFSGYFYRLNNATKCFEFLFEGFKDTTDYTRIDLAPQAPTFVGFNSLQQAVFPMNDEGQPILPKDDKGKTIFPFYEDFPLFPVDDSGAICVPLGDDGKPAFPRIPEEFGAYVPCDITGRVVLPLDEQGAPVYPRDEEGNVLMPFVISEDGSRKRAVYCSDEGVPILPYHNGELALAVHENEVLFQHEYQHKMMLLAQYGAPKQQVHNVPAVDEQFYQQHAFHYQSQQTDFQATPTSSSPATPTVSATPKSSVSNMLQKQLLFMRKKAENKAASPVNSTKAIPADRPNKPTKEKEKAEKRYIPEPSRMSRQLDELRKQEKRRRTRSRSLTWSPERSRSRSRERRRKSDKKRRERSRSSSVEYEVRRSEKKSSKRR